MLQESEREILRKVARDAAARAMGVQAPGSQAIVADSPLSRPAHVFVTWIRDGRPRGRSGTTDTARALTLEVQEHAASALLHDPRFAPATVKELPRYVPEISVLSSFDEISDSLGLVAGLHGVIVEKGKRRGVVLPQDGVPFGWDATRILSQACLRAGLPEESWKSTSPPRLLRFTAEVF